MKQFDKVVSEMTDGREFHFYAFNFSIPTNQLIGSHPNCISCSGLEEGMACYKEVVGEARQIKGWKRKLLLLLSFLGRREAPRNIPKDGKLYALTDKAFPGRESVNVFDREACLRILQERDEEPKIPSGSFIIPIDAVSHVGLMDLEVHTRLISDCVNTLLRTSRSKIYIKFHPAQDKDDKDAFIEAIPGSNRVEYLSDKCSIEKYIFDKKNYIFVGLVSSLLLYSSLGNNKAYTLCEEAKFIKEPNLPSVFFEAVDGWDRYITSVSPKYIS